MIYAMPVQSFILKPNEFTKSCKLIHKYMTIENALKLLNGGYIWLSSPLAWTDPFEKRFIYATYKNGKKFGLQGRVFCSCFTNNATSEASWKAYSDNSICIKFAFYRKELMNAFENFSRINTNGLLFFDKVEYMQTENIKKPLKEIPFNPCISSGATVKSPEFKERLLMLKRLSFKYENEYRVIWLRQTPASESLKGIKIDIPNIRCR